MSFEAMTWAVKQPLPAMQKLALLMLANRCNGDTGQCNPSHDRLIEDCGMSKSALKAAIKALEDKGLLTIQQRKKEGASLPNQYYLHLKMQYKGEGSPENPTCLEKTDTGFLETGEGSPKTYKPVTKPVSETGSSNPPLAVGDSGGADAEPPKDSQEKNVNLKETLAKKKQEKEEGLIKATGDSVLYILWKQRMAVITNTFEADLTNAEKKQLKVFREKVGSVDQARELLDYALQHWTDFVIFCNKKTGLSGGPDQPVFWFLVKHAMLLVQLNAEQKAKKVIKQVQHVPTPAPTPPKVFDKQPDIVHSDSVGMESDEPSFSSAADVMAHMEALQKQQNKK